MKNKILLLVLSLLIFHSNTFAQNGKIIYEEHFDNNTKLWADGENVIGIVHVQNGKLYLENKRVKYPASEVVPGLKLPDDNYSIEVTTRWKTNGTKGMYYAYGIVLDNYSFLISANGDRKMMYNNPKLNKETLYEGWAGQQPSIKRYGSGDNKLKINVSNGFAEFYVNNTLMFKKQVRLQNKYLAFMNEGLEAVEYDDLVIREIKPFETIIDETLTDKIQNWKGFSSVAVLSSDNKRIYALKHLLEEDTLMMNHLICYDAESGNIIASYPNIKNCTAMALDSDKKILAVCSSNEIKMYSETDLNSPAKTIVTKNILDTIFFSSDFKTISGISHQILGNDKVRYTLHKWNTETGKSIGEKVLNSN